MKNTMPGYEKRKVAIDLLKHFSGLSVGIIALSASFLGNLSQLSNSKNSVIFAVINFFLVIVFSSLASYLFLANIQKLEYRSFSHYLLRFSLLIVFLSFFSGIGAFVYLILENV